MLLAGLPLLLVAVPFLPAVALGLALSGAGVMWVEMQAWIRIQEDIREDLRARVFGLADMLLVGGAATGALLAGLAHLAGPVAALLLAGSALPAAAFAIWRGAPSRKHCAAASPQQQAIERRDTPGDSRPKSKRGGRS